MKGNWVRGTKGNFKGNFERQFQKQILKVFWLGEPMEIGGNKGKRERKRKREKQMEKGARPGEPMGANAIAPPLYTE